MVIAPKKLAKRCRFSPFDMQEMQVSQPITLALQDLARGDKTALDRLLPYVYAELRKLAGHYLRREREGHTLQPTALVHEAYFRLIDPSQPDFQGRSHFLGVAAHVMRQILPTMRVPEMLPNAGRARWFSHSMNPWIRQSQAMLPWFVSMTRCGR